MSVPDKQTIYVDIDDEITSIIEKVRSSSGRIVALVLPKRATVLQSIINMKLLKKSALSAKKNLVLITSETGLLPLAGSIGLHVAATLQSKPEVPRIPDMDNSETDEIDDDAPILDPHKTVGSLAAEAGMDDDTETIALDNEDISDSNAEIATIKSKKQKKGFKVPNFDRFRIGIVVSALLLIALVVGWAFAFIILPKATITITTDTSTTVSKIDFTANTTAQDVDLSKAIIPAVLKEVKKTDTEKTTATGKKDNGTKAIGTMTVFNCTDGDTEVPAGTVFTSGSIKFITDVNVVVPASNFFSNKNCKKDRSAQVAVTARSGGAESNLAAGNIFTSNFANTLTGSGSAMTGGTTNIVTVVSQEDIDAAAAKMKNRLDGVAKKELAVLMISSSLKSLDETQAISAPAITASPVVGTESPGEVTVTSVTTYSQIGIKADYLSQLIKKDTLAKIEATKQGILDDGLGGAVIHLVTRKSPTEFAFNMQAIVTAGPQLNAETIKNEIKGKKRGDVESFIGKKTGVKDVTVTYAPFWVLSTPKSTKKITVIIQKPVVTKQTSPTYVP